MNDWSSSRFFSKSKQIYQENQAKILNLLIEKKDGKLLDIGCNDGNFTIELAKKSKCSPYGIEINKALALRAKDRKVHVKIADANDELPFSNNYFDIIVSNQLLEHLSNVDNFFRETHRILKEDGILLISTTNISSFHNLGMIIVGMQPPSFHVSEIQVGNPLYGIKTDGHQQIFTLSALKDLAKYHGFQISNTFGTGHYFLPRFISRLLSKITPRYCIFIGLVLKKDFKLNQEN